MLTALHVALSRYLSEISVTNYDIPRGWPKPRFWLGQSVCLVADDRNTGMIVGVEFMQESIADEFETESGWWYTIALTGSSPRYRLEPQMMQPEDQVQALTQVYTR